MWRAFTNEREIAFRKWMGVERPDVTLVRGRFGKVEDAGVDSSTKATTACTHMKGAAREVATVFAALLSRSITCGSVLQAGAPYPRPTAPGKCDRSLLNACSTDVSELRKQLDKWSRELPKLWQ